MLNRFYETLIASLIVASVASSMQSFTDFCLLCGVKCTHLMIVTSRSTSHAQALARFSAHALRTATREVRDCGPYRTRLVHAHHPSQHSFCSAFRSSEVSSCWVISFRILLQRWVVCIRKVLHQPAALVCLCFGRFSRKSIVLNFLRRKFQASRSVTALHLSKFRQVAICSP